MLTTRISPIMAKKHKGVFWACGGVAAILFLMVIYSLQIGAEVAGQYAILADAAKEMRYEATHANLLLERERIGEHLDTVAELDQSRRRAEHLNQVLLQGGVYQGIKVPSFDDSQLMGCLHDVRNQQLEFYDLLEDYGACVSNVDGNGEVRQFAVMSSFQYDHLTCNSPWLATWG